MLKNSKAWRILAVPLFQDNYSYIVLGSAKNKAVLIDPANPPVILEYLKRSLPTVKVTCILYTHKHWDHAGGSQELISQIGSNELLVVAGKEDGDSIKGSNLLVEGDKDIQVNDSTVRVYNVPCHTKGHVLYHFKESSIFDYPEPEGNWLTMENKPVRSFESVECVFTGDTLFSGGCGRFFQGNSRQMLENMKKISSLPDNVDIFNGHEYTLQNLRWATQVEPSNDHLKSYLKQCQEESCSLPTTVGREKQVNVFMRVLNPSEELRKFGTDPEQLLLTLRQMKNDNRTNLL